MRPRQQVVATIAVTLAAIIAFTGRVSGIAMADGAVPLGGGAGIIVNGTYCTLATIGHDNSGALVGLTAATCGGPGSSVDIEGGPGGVGNVVAANDDLDYAVIKFDPTKAPRPRTSPVSRSTALDKTRAALDNRSAHKAGPPVTAAVLSSLEAQNRASSRRTCRRGNQAMTERRSPLMANWSA
jgi:hypothetical protein